MPARYDLSLMRYLLISPVIVSVVSKFAGRIMSWLGPGSLSLMVARSLPSCLSLFLSALLLIGTPLFVRVS